ncbi:WbuC family cupin fold metalloprotein [Chromobacterium alticapitis]|uniref:Cupin fold metalloprotein WbuC cupin domain-containing protein n=1 Tax=Chromobacterium alticapitis TaxID=2073169 RepID=A0A2S5DBE2_9NEIS|nr:WbuC family cupin fold metalloprotein [Chromobacterium alticapitis]POZ60354.1 hypothetical protein C2I19_19270 [Chromobacterium alticapitis]
MWPIKSKLISRELIETVIRDSKGMPRKRIPILVHDSYEEMPQRFANCLAAESYIRPHLHEDENQWELVVWLAGEMLVVIFDERGAIQQKIELSQSKNRVFEIARNQYHAYIPLTDCAYFEIRNCQFTPGSDRRYADWAPEENSADAAPYIEWIKQAEIGHRYG